MSNDQQNDVAVLGGGCFWCTEAVFQELRGVRSVESGYCGGSTPDPTYEQVCSGRTEHAECVQIKFDSQQISYADLLQVFFQTHDPTTLNRQGADVGTQYRSVIFYQNEEQKQTAEETIDELSNNGAFDSPVVTELAAAQPFYPAEDYHQEYFEKHAHQPYCTAVIGPKLEKFRTKYRELLKG